MISQLSGGGASWPLTKCSAAENLPPSSLRYESAHSAMLPRYVVELSASSACTDRIVRGSRYCCATSATDWWPSVPQAAAVDAVRTRAEIESFMVAESSAEKTSGTVARGD